jgi:hypothetical protein
MSRVADGVHQSRQVDALSSGGHTWERQHHREIAIRKYRSKAVKSLVSTSRFRREPDPDLNREATRRFLKRRRTNATARSDARPEQAPPLRRIGSNTTVA